MDKFCDILLNITQAEISKDVIDLKIIKNKLKKINFNLNKCNQFLGTSLKLNECKDIFTRLSIKTTSKKDTMICSIPSYRNDLTREADLYEEVARVFGYNNIKSKNKFLISSKSFVYDNNTIEDTQPSLLKLKPAPFNPDNFMEFQNGEL